MLIIDMPMPKNCGECPLLYMEIVKCTVNGNDCTEYGSERPSWCPIVGVLPDEHGDLIDRDELRKMKVFSQEFNRYVVPMMYIEDAKPIIAAERKDDEQIH